MAIPQALATGFASRIRSGETTLYISTQPVARITKRATTAINYAELEDDFDIEGDDDYEDYDEGSDGPDVDGDFDDDNDDDQKIGSSLNGIDVNSSLNKFDPHSSETKRAAHPVRPIMYSQSILDEIAKNESQIIPIHISLENPDVFRVQDFFLWDANEQVLTPEQFAALTCADLDIPIGYSTQMAAQIKKQIADYIPPPSLPDSEIYVIVDLSVTLETRVYEDKFEWDLNGDLTPEEFSRVVVQDLGLPTEFLPAILHALYNSLLKIKKAWAEGLFPQEVDNFAAYGQEAGYRADLEGLGELWCPRIEELTPEEIQRREIDRERSSRRLKRESLRLGENSYADVDSLYSNRKRRRSRYDDDSRLNSPVW